TQGLSETSFVDTSAVRGVRYFYVVTATNALGESVGSYEVTITPGRAAPGDFDGDGKTDIAVFRPATGTWFIRYSGTPTSAAIAWGGVGDVPVPADYDGDGVVDVAVFRPASGTWFIRYSATPTSATIVWGGSGDVAVPADYDGDGIADIAVFRPATG